MSKKLSAIGSSRQIGHQGFSPNTNRKLNNISGQLVQSKVKAEYRQPEDSRNESNSMLFKQYHNSGGVIMVSSFSNNPAKPEIIYKSFNPNHQLNRQSGKVKASPS